MHHNVFQVKDNTNGSFPSTSSKLISSLGSDSMMGALSSYLPHSMSLPDCSSVSLGECMSCPLQPWASKDLHCRGFEDMAVARGEAHGTQNPADFLRLAFGSVPRGNQQETVLLGGGETWGGGGG